MRGAISLALNDYRLLPVVAKECAVYVGSQCAGGGGIFIGLAQTAVGDSAGGAAGAGEAILSILALRNGLVPPTAGTRTVDPAIDLDVVVDTPREVALDAVMSNSFGFGGTNACLVFDKYTG